MQLAPSRRIVAAALVLSAAVLGWVIASASAATGPQKIVTGSLITRPRGTLAPGTKVSSARLFGLRAFTDASHGFALADVGSAQYPVATVDGGKTWKTDGPALHLNAAQAPLAVVDISAAGRNTLFAWGTGQVIDATSDGGKHWYRALFQGLPVAVIRNPLGHLVAFVDASTGAHGASGVTWQYVSKDGGHSWRYDTTVGGS
jgi:photosystem II stability/assembly factor-like uncharacterized protein